MEQISDILIDEETKTPIYTGSFLAIADVNRHDKNRWNWLLEQTKYSQGELFHRLLDVYFEHTYEENQPDIPEPDPEPEYPDVPTNPSTDGKVVELYGEFEFSFQPGYQTTQVFGLFSLNCEYVSNTKQLKLAFQDLNPNLKRFIKLSVRRYDKVMTELFTADLSNADKMPITLDLSQFDLMTNEHVQVRVFYEIYKTSMAF